MEFFFKSKPFFTHQFDSYQVKKKRTNPERTAIPNRLGTLLQPDDCDTLSNPESNSPGSIPSYPFESIAFNSAVPFGIFCNSWITASFVSRMPSDTV